MIYEQGDDGGWGAYLPDLPGGVAVGATRAEIDVRIEEALAVYVAEMRAAGRSLPTPSRDTAR